MLIQLVEPHHWALSPYEAQSLQKQMRERVRVTPHSGNVSRLAGIELAHSRSSNHLRVGIAILSFPELALLECVTHVHQSDFPYIPGLLSFREVPAILEALGKLTQVPDLLLVNGHGVAHPNGLGVASHLGVLLDLPTVGCARSVLVGSYVEPELFAGASSSLVWQGEIIGTVYRSRNRVAPLFISVGHGLSRQQAQDWVVACCQHYRLPEPLRLAQIALGASKSGGKPA